MAVSGEAEMNEDAFNMEVRKFLKRLGVSSQREIERAVREAVERGAIAGSGPIRVRATVVAESVDLDHTIEGEIALE
jgi:hypothetical protein